MYEKPGMARALAAAREVALAHSVACDDAVVLAGGSNVVVHLKPAPVVARVMTATAVLHQDVEAWLAREVAIGVLLGGRGLGVPPSDAFAPRPYQRDGLWMTFWEFVEHDTSGALPSAHELGGSLRVLHAALADFAGELGTLRDVRDWLDQLLVQLHPSPKLDNQTIDSLRGQLQTLTPTVFDSSLPVQAIHADASLSNLFRTDIGLLWNDFEDACVGPVHWDVAGLVAEARAAGGSEGFVADFLRAYGGVELEELDDFIEAEHLFTTIWQAFEAQRRAAESGM
ncbi:MAG: phosphotransferase [Actinomycetes bacterium]